MENMELLTRAKNYMQALANGIDPFTGEEITDDSVINNIRMSRCFFYVTDVPEKVIANGGEVTAARSSSKQSYTQLSPEMIANFPYSDSPKGISNIVKALRDPVGENGKPLSAVQITTWLTREGYLA